MAFVGYFILSQQSLAHNQVLFVYQSKNNEKTLYVPYQYINQPWLYAEMQNPKDVPKEVASVQFNVALKCHFFVVEPTSLFLNYYSVTCK